MAQGPFTASRVLELLESLAGEPAMAVENRADITTFLDSHEGGLGYSQLNELLLALGYDKIPPQLFDFLCLGRLNPKANSKLENTQHLEEAVDRFQQLALYAYGNVKFAYKQLCRSPERLEDWIDLLTPVKDTRYVNRLAPALPLKAIPATQRYYLGYLVERELKDRLAADPSDVNAQNELKKRAAIVEDGKRNQIAYLTSDYLDVYVATSMRERHEFLSVAQISEAVFQHPLLKKLNLRYFDPTLAYCHDRIDKGLSEALMLKRAKCTLFLAQETDTLGKDSELASTLAQGKPVIAYVPKGSKRFVQALLGSLRKCYAGKSDIELMLDQLRVFKPELAWKDSRVRRWLEGKDLNKDKIREFFEERVREHYDQRARTLRESHPLGIQVHLETGVAVGVLVVREIKTCAELIRRIMLGENRFKVADLKKESSKTHLVLEEELSGCVYRVMTYDKALTHTFWNFYLR